MPITVRVLLGAAAVAVLALFAAYQFAGNTRNSVVIGYQTDVDPTKVAQAEGLYAKAIGQPIVWRKFDSGADVITALAAGDIDFGDLGSSPLAVGTTRELPIATIAVISRLGASEALVARNGSGIHGPEDLIGKRVAAPFISTAHYSLLAALNHWHIDPNQVRLINLSPPALAAEWARGDIDAAYVWDPALGKLKANGQVLTDSERVASWGAPTFDVWVVRKDFARHRASDVAAFVRVTLQALAEYRRNGSAWIAQSHQAREIATITGARQEEVPGLLASNYYPLAAEQASSQFLGGGLADDLAATATFLKAQGKVDRVLLDYKPYVDKTYVQSLAKTEGF